MAIIPVRVALALFVGLTSVAVSAPAIAVDDAPVRLALAVPIVVPANDTGLISADALALYTSPQGLLSRQLNAVIDRPVAIAIDPMILVSIRVLGTSAPPSATAWLDQLAHAGNESFELPYANSDITLATQAGSSAVVEPESFDFAIDPTLFAEPSDETPVPTPTATAGEPLIPELPASEDLSNWGYTIPSLGWPRANSVVSGDLGALALAFETVIVASGNTADATSSSVRIGATPAIVSDDATSTAFATATSAPTLDSWQSALEELTHSAAAAGSRLSDTPLVFASLDTVSALNNTRLSDTLSALESTAGLELAELSEIISTSPTDAALVDQPQSPERISVMGQLLNAASAEASFASILETPQDLTSPRRLELLALSSNQWHVSPAGWSVATAQFQAQSAEILAAVHVVRSSSFNLLADSATLPILVSNDLPFSVTVYITVRPGTALLAVGDSNVELVVEPNSQGKGQIPVTAISNGTVRALVTLSSSTGVEIGSPTLAKINVQAGWETPIVLVIAALLVAIFALGIVRSVLRHRGSTKSQSVRHD